MELDNSEFLLTRNEVQDRFGIPKRYLEVAISRGEGPPLVRFGRTVRYRVSDLVVWINENRVDPETQAAASH